MGKRVVVIACWLLYFFPLSARIIFSSIDTAGFYRLADDVTNQISINVSDVTLDLNGHRISGGTNGIAIAAGLDRVTIKNGMVDGTADGISVGAGATNITLDGILAKDSVVGFNFTQVTGGLIKNCEMTQNATGLELDNCHKIVVENCTASCNTHAGYDLLSSTTNCFENCKALSTGEGNTNVTDNNVFGFVSTNGYGNIFERCIANSTQALSTTDYNSTIAGFALRGTEGCTKIVESESANSTTSPDGSTIPHGILLEATLNQIVPVAGALGTGGTPFTVDWSPDGKHVAVGGLGLETAGSGAEFQVFQFDRVAGTLSAVAGALGTEGNVNSVDWSPDGNCIVAGGGGFTGGTGDALQILSFDRAAGTLSSITGALGTDGFVLGVDWSPDGKFIAVGGSGLTGGSGDELQVFQFDRIAGTLSSITGALGTAGNVNSVDWSPDGKYIAVGGSGLTGGSGDELQVFQFDRIAGTLSSITGALGTAGIVNSVDWSPDGKYIAVGGSGLTGGSGDELQVFQFDRIAGTLSSITGALGTAGNVNSVDWSPDGTYILVGGNGLTGGTADEMQILLFDRAAGTLTAITGSFGTVGIIVNTVDWSPDGNHIASGGTLSGNDFQIRTGLTFPSKNLIKNNTVYCNSGNECPGGVGISGSNIANLIIGNTAYSNPIPRGTNAPIVSSNYQFVINVFDGLLSGIPSPVQNVSIASCKPACLTGDIAFQNSLIQGKLASISSTVEVIATTADLIESKLCDIQTNADILLEEVDIIESAVDAISSSCVPTAIMAPGTISTAGTYCLANDISGTITISVSDVVLDLNNYTVSDGITINGSLDRVTIKNGQVLGSGDAILVNAGSSNITIADVTVKNAIRGINLDSVSGGLIKNCEMTLNTTGLELDNCDKVVVKDSVALCNLQAGYDLISSGTNCFENCKALSTGEGNTALINNNVFGFVTTNGFGNVFEKCIANSTQALTTTDSNSTIAGIAFRGTESCSKIIECEAANSMSSVTGVTVPFGILLATTLDQSVSVTGALGTAGNVETVSWSPDGKFIAVGGADLTGGSGDELQIFSFDRTAGTLSLITGALGAAGSVLSVDWSPDGRYVALGGSSLTGGSGDELQIFSFDRAAGTLSLITGALDAAANTFVESVNWSPDGSFIAVGGTGLAGGSGDEFQIFSFDRAAGALSLITGALGAAGNVESVNWSPDGSFIAVGGFGLTGGSGDEFQIFSFDRGAGTLSLITGALGTAGFVESVNWSPDGKFIAVGGNGLTGGSGDELQIFSFDRAAGTLSLITGALDAAANTFVESVNWSPDGSFIAVGGSSLTGGSGDEFQIFSFDRGARTLISITGALGVVGIVEGLNWSPDGSFVAVGGRGLTGGSGDEFQIVTGLTFPSKNVIKNNTVYCNSGNECPGGVGISGSNIANMIIENRAYSNPILRGANAPIVSSNYQFVTNVFDESTNVYSSPIQNASTPGCKVVGLTVNVKEELRVLTEIACGLQSKIETILAAV